MKDRVYIYSYGISSDYDTRPPENLAELISFLEAKLAEVPDEYKNSAICEIDNDGDGYGCHWHTIDISYSPTR